MSGNDLPRKNIQIHTDTYERFKKYGQYKESADDILVRLLDMADKLTELVKEGKVK
jgi:predicted CopG family antitoxin